MAEPQESPEVFTEGLIRTIREGKFDLYVLTPFELRFVVMELLELITKLSMVASVGDGDRRLARVRKLHIDTLANIERLFKDDNNAS